MGRVDDHCFGFRTEHSAQRRAHRGRRTQHLGQHRGRLSGAITVERIEHNAQALGGATADA